MLALHVQASVKVSENGSFNVFNRSQEFRFTPEGFFRRKGRSKGPSREDEEQLSFKVRPLAVRAHSVRRPVEDTGIFVLPESAQLGLSSSMHADIR